MLLGGQRPGQTFELGMHWFIRIALADQHYGDVSFTRAATARCSEGFHHVTFTVGCDFIAAWTVWIAEIEWRLSDLSDGSEKISDSHGKVRSDFGAETVHGILDIVTQKFATRFAHEKKKSP